MLRVKRLKQGHGRNESGSCPPKEQQQLHWQENTHSISTCTPRPSWKALGGRCIAPHGWRNTFAPHFFNFQKYICAEMAASVAFSGNTRAHTNTPTQHTSTSSRTCCLNTTCAASIKTTIASQIDRWWSRAVSVLFFSLSYAGSTLQYCFISPPSHLELRNIATYALRLHKHYEGKKKRQPVYKSETGKKAWLICFMSKVYTCSTLQILKQILPHFPPCLSTFLAALLFLRRQPTDDVFPSCHLFPSRGVTLHSVAWGKLSSFFFPFPFSHSSLTALALSCLSPSTPLLLPRSLLF